MWSTSRRWERHWTAPLGAASGLVVFFVSVLAIPVSAAESLALSDRELVGWIMALYGVPGLLTLLLVARFRQPLLLTGNVFLLIFVASLGADVPWPELVGAAVVAGVVVLVLGPLGVTGWLARWLPAPIVFAVLAGAVVGFFVDLFTAAGQEPLVVGATLVVYVASRRLVEPRIPALLPALATGVVLAIATGRTGSVPPDIHLLPTFVVPELSLAALLTVTPVMVALVTVQANAPSTVFLHEQAFDPPEPVVNAVSGAGSVVASLLGPVGVSLSLPATALCAGPDAGEKEHRYIAAYIAGFVSLLIGLGAGLATALVGVLPSSLLAAFVGLAVVGVLGTALRSMIAGPLLVGPLFAFGIAQSELELFQLGPLFWALVVGLTVSVVLERDGLRQLRAHG